MVKPSRSERVAAADLLARRRSGVLMHPSSLPGRFGMGCIGGHARRFVELLAEAGQSVWQMLPIGPLGRELCPYVPMSSFAGNELLIDLEDLLEEGLLSEGDLPASELEAGHVHEGELRAFYELALGRAFSRMRPEQRREMERYRSENALWLEDYALYRALHAKTLGVAWPDWPPGLSLRDAGAMAGLRQELSAEMDAQVFRQWLFARQWRRLRDCARAKGVRLFGDLPLYVNQDSVDVWQNPEAFALDARGRAEFVTGVPGDPAFPQGQLWGHPCYDWERMAEDGYRYFVERLRAQLELFDWVRIDHFRGLEAYWRVPAGASDASAGSWQPGPGADLFERVQAELGEAALVAEDLGHITGPVRELLRRYALPGMIVLHFAWWRIGSGFHPLRHRQARVVYTGTHDTNTTRGWFEDEITERELRNWELWLGREVEDPAADLIGIAMDSPAKIAIVPAQDWFSLGSEARMNVPGVVGDLWAWRLTERQFLEWPVQRMRGLAEESGRC
ncbi:MAG: 4-alpha-glucanotransferase [Planctomycetota bacterium]|nr:MAG: 4-alpha-glucanotransferase [Planctomycetota bacterium]